MQFLRVPVGVPKDALTVAVNVALWPNTVGLVKEATVVVVVALFTVNTLLTALLRPLALAVNCLLVPAASIRRSLKLAVPLPAPVPMSMLVVPWSGPVPPVRLTVRVRLPGRPTVDKLPKASWLWATG